jgi:hypothetical protein
LNEENCPPSLTSTVKTSLASNAKYAFRVGGINSLGTGQMSNYIVFQTYPEDWPTGIQNCKQIKTKNGVRLCWCPQQRIKNYSVEAEMKCESGVKYESVYDGIQPTCEIKDEILNNQDYHFKKPGSCKKQLNIRITATNDKGTGPFFKTSVDINID